MAIEKMLKDATTESSRQLVLQQTLGNLGGARIGALSAVQVERKRQRKHFGL